MRADVGSSPAAAAAAPEMASWPGASGSGSQPEVEGPPWNSSGASRKIWSSLMSAYGREARYAASNGLPPPPRPVWEPGKNTPKTRNPPGWVLQTQQRIADGQAAAAEAAADARRAAAAAAAAASTALGGYRGLGAQACEDTDPGDAAASPTMEHDGPPARIPIRRKLACTHGARHPRS